MGASRRKDSRSIPLVLSGLAFRNGQVALKRSLLERIRRAVQDRLRWVRSLCSIFVVGIAFQFCPPAFAGEPTHDWTASSPTSDAGQDSQLHTFDTYPIGEQCCHINPAHPLRDVAPVSIASGTDLRFFPAIVTEHDKSLRSLTPDTTVLPAPTLEHAAALGRTLYLTTLRLRI